MFNSRVKEAYRVVHYKDIVPHLPLGAMFFHHAFQEIYEDENGNVKACSLTDSEDKTCSSQFWICEITPHLTYLGMCMGGGCGQCSTAIQTTFLN